MLNVLYKRVYETCEKNMNEWILIVYDISANHYVGIPVYQEEREGCIYCPSIKKYVNINRIDDYNRSKMNRCIYLKGKPLTLSDKDYTKILKESKNALISFLSNNVLSNVDGVNYLKWCRDKYIINEKDTKIDILKQNAIYWINLGVGIGSELRKIRPAILWRSTSDKKMWTIIPLTTKKRKDKYYFHYDLECLSEGTAKIENLTNISYKRIISPYFSKNKLAIITNNDYKQIEDLISQYYLFQK